jgi:hypothetical protein
VRRLLLALALVSLPLQAWATWARVGTFAVGNETTQDSQIVFTTTATLEAGNVGVCVIAHDETGTGTTDGDNGQLTSVTDSAGNTWEKGMEFCNMQTSVVRNGACASIWYTRARFQLTSGGTVTVDFLGTPAKAGTCDEFTITVNGSVSLAPGSNGLANDGADPGSMTDATGLSAPYLFVRGTACESNVTTYTADADYVGFGGSTTTSTANTGTAATSMGARGESRIATEATSAASDPTHAAADCASAMLALRDVACQVQSLMGVGCR